MKKNQTDEVARKTLDLNFEVNLFNNRLKSHLDIGTVDIQVLTQLQKTTELISKLVGDCIIIDVDSINVEENSEVLQLHRQLYCTVCNTAIQIDSHRVKEHLTKYPHQHAVAKALAKKQKKQPGAGSISETNQEATKKETPRENSQPTEQQKTTEKNAVEQKPNKLSKKVQVFLRDRNLEKLSKTLAEESERIKMQAKHNVAIDSIEKALVSKYPDVKVYPFGSRVSGLCSRSSDLDLFVDLKNQYYSNPSHITQSTFKNIEQLLKKTKDWIEFFCITGARTPILQTFFRPENLPCDLSFSNGLSHCNTKLINYYIGIQPLFSQIANIVKEWSNIADTKMNTYTVTLLLVYYFQLVKLLPTVHDLQKNIKENDKPIGYWYGHIDEKMVWPEKSDDFRKHLIGFFSYYGNSFDFKNMVVCPYLGIPLEKTRFEHGKENLPAELKTYMDYMKKIDVRNADELTDLFAYEKPMVVQDPFELIHNVSKGVRPQSVERFVLFCKLTAETLKAKKIL